MESQMSTDLIRSSSFSIAQQHYLQGFFAGVAQRGVMPFVGHTANGQITNDPASCAANQAAEEAEPTWFRTPLSELPKEERWKQEENALDIWDKLVAHAKEDKALAPDDLFRFKFHGLFYVAPAQDSFMLRMRMPGGILRAHQLRGLAQMAADWDAGKATLYSVPCLPFVEQPDEEYNLIFNTGRTVEHWHTRTKTAKVEMLDSMVPNAWLEMNPVDAAKLELRPHDRVNVVSRRSTVRNIELRITSIVAPGQVFMPFHFSETNSNFVTLGAFDPISREPNFKQCAVRVEKFFKTLK